jgi:hypothetical protein
MKNACLLGVLISLAACLGGCETQNTPATAVAPAPPPPPPPPPQVNESSANTPELPPPALPSTNQATEDPPAGSNEVQKVRPVVKPHPSLPVIGPLEVKEFAGEFLTDSAAASKKYEKRRVRVTGEVTSTTTFDGKHGATISAPSQTKPVHNVDLLLDAPASVQVFDPVVVEGDFQRFEGNVPQLANCTITKAAR